MVLLFKKRYNRTKWPLVIKHKLENHQDDYNSHHSTFYEENVIYFIVSGEISVYLMKIKVVSITSELISYHFTIVNDTIYIFTLRFGRLRFSSLFQKWMLPPLQIV